MGKNNGVESPRVSSNESSQSKPKLRKVKKKRWRLKKFGNKANKAESGLEKREAENTVTMGENTKPTAGNNDSHMTQVDSLNFSPKSSGCPHTAQTQTDSQVGKPINTRINLEPGLYWDAQNTLLEVKSLPDGSAKWIAPISRPG